MLTFTGKVKKGLKIGRELGYPTANLACDIEVFPALGVYVAYATMRDSRYEAVCVIGARYDGAVPLVEVHLFNFSGDAYDEIIEVELRDKISDIGTFDSHLLVKKIESDLRAAREWFTRESLPVKDKLNE
ncbi:MAG: riboflavin kinase [bacterium]|nr:riboflavin kinase [bacterium]